jgi:hypothetical protein
MNQLPIPARDPKSTPNPLFVKLLKTGLRKLWMARYSNRQCSRKRHEFICHTVNNIELQKVIASRLKVNGFWGQTYGGWVRVEMNMDYIQQKEIQAARKRWMLDLIEEFS